MNNHRRTIFHMKFFYFLAYFSFGGLFPLLSVYLQNEVGLTGAQIGMIMSIGPIVMLLSQPVWGILSDYTRKPRILLSIAAVGTGAMGLMYLFAEDYIWLVVIAAGVALFQSAVIPLSDSMAMNYVHEHGGDYGSIRLWGAAGFAVSVLIMGSLSDWLGQSVIFYGFAIVLFISAFYALKMPKDTTVVRVEILKGMKQLIKVPRFVLFLIITFLVFGPIMANNFYFSLLIQFAGGTLAGVGFAFLLAAGSEIPFMRWVGGWIKKRGIIMVLFLAALASGLRWLFYAAGPSPTFIYVTTIIQGFSIGLFIPAALQYVTELAPKEIKATAVAIYSAVGNGLGAWFFTYTAGVIMDWDSILGVYLFYGIMTLIGAALILVIMRQEKKSSIQQQVT
ncbi:MFS transporter [Bacillus shivajii]|uniref:MFS transporter n=1 Tax=Bacillus shivajii TaxID=1983719 RepID=UPI001CF9348C|nr:major facilitator superfamily domain-containing protein 6 [Bacillus shivajii]UCZ52336.1 MFS transporter [Bacillus shivajii]